MDNPILSTILQESLLLFFLIGSFFALLLGLLFIISPQQAKRFSQHNNRWISIRRQTRALEIPRAIDHKLYRHHRLIGLFILLSSGYILYRFGFDYNHAQAISTLSGRVNETIAAWLLESLLWFLLPVSLLLVLAGGIIALKPSGLKGIEAPSNRWISTRRATQSIDKQHYFFDNWVNSHPRLFGLTLGLAALYNLSLFFIFLFKK